MKLPSIIALFLFGIAIAQTIYFYPLVPELVGSHFNAAGKVNQLAPKLSYFIIYFVSLGLTSCFTLVLPWSLRYIPTSMINLPHRDYWLSGEEREASLSFLTNHFSWFGIATMVLMVVIFHLTFLANLGSVKDINPTIFWALLGAFLLFVIAWVIVMIKRFPNPA